MHSIQDVNKMPLLTVEHLKIQTDQQVLVDDLSFELNAGETLAIVGESGSGKSVSSLALLGLLPKNLNISGQAIFAGQNLLQLKGEQQRQIRGKKIAMIFSRADDCAQSFASG